MSYFDCSGNAKAVQFLFSNNANKRGNWWDNSNFIQAKRVSGTNEWQITNDDLPQSQLWLRRRANTRSSDKWSTSRNNPVYQIRRQVATERAAKDFEADIEESGEIAI